MWTSTPGDRPSPPHLAPSVAGFFELNGTCRAACAVGCLSEQVLSYGFLNETLSTPGARSWPACRTARQANFEARFLIRGVGKKVLPAPVTLLESSHKTLQPGMCRVAAERKSAVLLGFKAEQLRLQSSPH